MILSLKVAYLRLLFWLAAKCVGKLKAEQDFSRFAASLRPELISKYGKESTDFAFQEMRKRGCGWLKDEVAE